MKLISSSVTVAFLTCISVASLLLLHCRHVAADLRSDSALTVVENAEEGGGGAGGDEEEEANVNIEVIQPTEQWQTLKPGQAVPAGSHVKLNLQTGQREVRLGEEQLKYWTQDHRRGEESHSFSSPDELKQAMKNIKEDLNPDSVASKYRPLEELKKDMAQLDLLVETDGQILRRLLDQFNSSNSTTEQRLNILLELEYLVHQVDNAQTLCSMGGLQVILDCLNSSDFRLQERSAFVLGSAMASNPVVQVKAVESGALQLLLTALATTQPLRVKKKVLFAVAALLRHFPYTQRTFLSHGGLQVLLELFRADGGGVLRTRIATMLYDMISEKELISQTGLDPALDAANEDRVRQYSEVSLEGELLEKGWCTLVPQLLESTEHDYREKALRALLAMAPTCLDQYRSDSSLLGSLLSLREQYQEMVQSEMILGEENSYFAEIAELIDSQSDKIHLQLRVEELQHKYEPKEAKMYLIQKRKKEKLPVDILPSSQESPLDKGGQIVTVETDVMHDMTTDPKADISPKTEAQSSTKGLELTVPRAAKCVKISGEEPVVIPNVSYPVTDRTETEMEGNQQQNKREERIKKQRTVEMIHVSSMSTMENECAQQ